MATQATRALRWTRNKYGAANPEVFYDTNIVVAANETFVAGDLVTITPGTGTIAEYVANGANISGIALEDAVVGSPIKIQLINPGDVFIANVYHATPASSVTAITELGVTYAAASSAAGIWGPSLATTTDTDAVLKIIGFVYGPDTDSSGVPYNKAIGDTNGEVYCTFVPNTIDTADGSLGNILDFA